MTYNGIASAALAVCLAGAPAGLAMAQPEATTAPVRLPVAADTGAPDGAALPAPAAPGGSQGAPAPADAATDWQTNTTELLTAVMAGRWIDAVAGFMLLLVAGLRAFGRRLTPWFATRAGGWTLNLATATMLSIAVSLQTVGQLTLGTLLDALLLGLAAAGGYQALRDVKHARNAAVRRAGQS